MTGGPDLAIVVPALNAARTLRATLRRVPVGELPSTTVLVVDDGSRDGTAAVAREVAAEAGLDVTVLVHEVNRGYGAAQKTAFRHALAAGCACAVLLHSDGQYAPEELPRVAGPLLRGEAEVVVGSRVASGRAVNEGMPLSRYVGNRVLSFIANRLYGLSFTEYHTGYMGYSACALRRIPFERLGDRFHFDGEMLLCAGKLGLRVVEVPVSTHFGPESSSLAVLPYLREVAGVMWRYAAGGYDFLPDRGTAGKSGGR